MCAEAAETDRLKLSLEMRQMVPTWPCKEECVKTCLGCKWRRCKERNICKYPQYLGYRAENPKNLMFLTVMYLLFVFVGKSKDSTEGRSMVQDGNGGSQDSDRREGGMM